MHVNQLTNFNTPLQAKLYTFNKFSLQHKSLNKGEGRAFAIMSAICWQRRNVMQVDILIVNLLTDEVLVNLDVLGAIMVNRVLHYANGGFIITVKKNLLFIGNLQAVE